MVQEGPLVEANNEQELDQVSDRPEDKQSVEASTNQQHDEDKDKSLQQIENQDVTSEHAIKRQSEAMSDRKVEEEEQKSNAFDHVPENNEVVKLTVHDDIDKANELAVNNEQDISA